MGAVDMIENPEVNPIQGQFRTYDDVRRELDVHQQRARASAIAAGSHRPIFRNEYIFFLGSGGKVMLGRMCNVPPGKGNHEDVSVDVTEYTPLPPRPLQGQASDFLGCFEPCINPRYNPNHAGSKKFLRHHGLPRASLLVLDVQTFTSGKKLYVQADSLRLLERAFPGFKLPAQLPELHRRNGGGGRGGRSDVADGGDSSDSAGNDGEACWDCGDGGRGGGGSRGSSGRAIGCGGGGGGGGGGVAGAPAGGPPPAHKGGGQTKTKKKRKKCRHPEYCHSSPLAEESESEEHDSSSAVDSRARGPLSQLRRELYGCRVMVPKEMWPDETCDGDGWPGEVVAISRDQSTTKVTVDGHTYAFPVSMVVTWCRL